MLYDDATLKSLLSAQESGLLDGPLKKGGMRGIIEALNYSAAHMVLPCVIAYKNRTT